MQRSPKSSFRASKDRSRRNSATYNRTPRTLHCCRAAQLEEKLPHCWWENNGVIYKGRYCETHAAEMLEGSFKTRNLLIADLTTKHLLGENPDEFPF